MHLTSTFAHQWSGRLIEEIVFLVLEECISLKVVWGILVKICLKISLFTLQYSFVSYDCDWCSSQKKMSLFWQIFWLGKISCKLMTYIFGSSGLTSQCIRMASIGGEVLAHLLNFADLLLQGNMIINIGSHDHSPKKHDFDYQQFILCMISIYYVGQRQYISDLKDYW